MRSKVRVLRNLHACSSGNHDKGTDDFPRGARNNQNNMHRFHGNTKIWYQLPVK